MNRQIIQVKDGMYLVHRIVPDEEKYDTKILKQYWNCTHAFRNGGKLFLCREIPSIEFEEIKTETEIKTKKKKNAKSKSKSQHRLEHNSGSNS